MTADRICAVVVTHNRKELLVRLLKALIQQTVKPHCIYVVDNASTDGTAEALVSAGMLDPYFGDSSVKSLELSGNRVDIVYHRLRENLGGAGGFYVGMRRAYEDGCSLLWLMDDDGLPEERCLEVLLRELYRNNLDVVGPVVLSLEKPSELSFPTKKCKTVDDCYRFAKDGLVQGMLSLFNGILLKRSVISKVGFPKKEFFIWGDEVEYYYRLKKNKFRIATTLNARFYHPKSRLLVHKAFGGLINILYTQDAKRSFIFLRNYFYIHLRYDPLRYLILLAKYMYFYTVVRKNPREFLLFLKALLYGTLGIWKEY